MEEDVIIVGGAVLVEAAVVRVEVLGCLPLQACILVLSRLIECLTFQPVYEPALISVNWQLKPQFSISFFDYVLVHCALFLLKLQ